MILEGLESLGQATLPEPCLKPAFRCVRTPLTTRLELSPDESVRKKRDICAVVTSVQSKCCGLPKVRRCQHLHRGIGRVSLLSLRSRGHRQAPVPTRARDLPSPLGEVVLENQAVP